MRVSSLPSPHPTCRPTPAAPSWRPRQMGCAPTPRAWGRWRRTMPSWSASLRRRRPRSSRRRPLRRRRTRRRPPPRRSWSRRPRRCRRAPCLAITIPRAGVFSQRFIRAGAPSEHSRPLPLPLPRSARPTCAPRSTPPTRSCAPSSRAPRRRPRSWRPGSWSWQRRRWAGGRGGVPLRRECSGHLGLQQAEDARWACCAHQQFSLGL